jgi:hypothetical protein
MSVFLDETKLSASVRDLVVPALVQAVEPLVAKVVASPLFSPEGFQVTIKVERLKSENK